MKQGIQPKEFIMTDEKDFKLDPKDNKGVGFFGKWAYHEQQKKKWLEEQKKKEQEKKE